MAVLKFIYDGPLDRRLKVQLDAATDDAVQDMAGACGGDAGPLIRALVMHAAHHWYGDDPRPTRLATRRNAPEDRVRFGRLAESMQAAINAAGIDEAAQRSAKASKAARARWARYNYYS